MIKKFRREAAKGAHIFTFCGKLYRVIDEFTIYHQDSETTYFKDLDF